MKFLGLGAVIGAWVPVMVGNTGSLGVALGVTLGVLMQWLGDQAGGDNDQ